jgi:hypothetical protein
MRRAGLTVLFVATSLVTTGCLVEQRYVTPEGGGPWAFAVDETTPPFFMSEDGNVYLVEQRVEIPFREPTDEELDALDELDDLQIPYATLPWLRRGDIEIQIDYTLSNLSLEDTVELTVTANGLNEFHEYNPGVRIVDDDLVVDFAGWERLIRLAPGERRSGTIREEHLDEIAVDLATVVNGVPNANQIVHPQNHSAVDARSQLFIPDVIPALTGVRVGMRVETDEGATAPPIVMELVVRVRDVRRVLSPRDVEPWVPPTPVLFGPADVEAMQMMMMTPP